jgi:chromosome segregation ATPase
MLLLNSGQSHNKCKTEAEKLKEEVAKNEATIEEQSPKVNSYYNTIQKNKEDFTNMERQISHLNMQKSSLERKVACVNESLATATQS